MRPSVRLSLPGWLRGAPVSGELSPVAGGLYLDGLRLERLLPSTGAVGEVHLTECWIPSGGSWQHAAGMLGAPAAPVLAAYGLTPGDFLRAPNGAVFGSLGDFSTVTITGVGPTWALIVAGTVPWAGSSTFLQQFLGGRLEGQYLPTNGRHFVGVQTSQGRQHVYLAAPGGATDLAADCLNCLLVGSAPLVTLAAGTVRLREGSLGVWASNAVAPVVSRLLAVTSSQIQVQGSWAELAPPSAGFTAGVTNPVNEATLTVASRVVENAIDGARIYRTGS